MEVPVESTTSKSKSNQMNLPAFALTPKQFLVVRRKQIQEEYPDAEAWAINATLESFMLDWSDIVWKAAEDGEILKPIVLDRLFEYSEYTWWQMFKFHPDAIPTGYINPKARSIARNKHIT